MWGDTPESRQIEDIFELRRLFGEEPYDEIEEEWIQENWNIEEEEEEQEEEEEREEEEEEDGEREEEENEEQEEEEERGMEEQEWIDKCKCFFSFL